MGKKAKSNPNTIALNKKARHNYFIEDRFEAGLVLTGWEVKSIRDGRVNLSESYVSMKDGEAFLYGCHITALKSASTHVLPDPIRARKLLLNNRELGRLFGAITKDGFTIIPLSMYWKKHLVKLEIGIGKGKKLYDKRATEKEKEWNRSKERVMKKHT